MSHPPRILIVEDDAFYREFLLRTLDHDHAVDTAEDGMQALTHLGRASYDLVLCDLRMPGISGRQLVQKIRQSCGPECILIIITGFEKDWSPVDATDVNVFAYLKKGNFGPKELRKVVQNGLLVHRDMQQKRMYEERLLDFSQQLEHKVEENSKALFESEEKYWNLFDQSLVGVYIQAGGRVRFSNQKLRDILGCPPERIGDCRIEDFLRPVARQAPLASPGGAGSGTSPFQEVALTALSGEERYALHSAGTILFEGTKATQGCLLDITEWKMLEQQLLQHHKMESLGTLISGITHEFNNILAAIIPQSEILLERARENPSIRRPAEIISAMAEKASRLTRQLLNMSRSSTLERRPVDVNTWIRESLTVLGPVLGSDIRVEIDLSPEAGWIEADPQHLDQLLMNLVLNARDAMPAGGVIRIATGTRPPAAPPPGRPPANAPFTEIIVEDTGTGIAEQDLPKVFDPFFTTKDTGKGTGMGLSVVYNLVKQNGGEIHATSRPGRGARFRAVFPRLPPKEASGVRARWNGTVLVAEKNRETRDLLRDVLGRLRFEVIPARDEREAVEIYSRKKDTIDWVILGRECLDPAALSPVARLLQINPRVKLLVANRGASSSREELRHPLMRPGARIEQFQVPAHEETLLRSLEEVMEGRSDRLPAKGEETVPPRSGPAAGTIEPDQGV